MDAMKKITTLILFVLVLLIAGVYDTHARRTPDKIFRGSEDNQWNNPNNWDPPGVPNSSDNVLIPRDATVTAAGGTIECNRLVNNGNINGADNLQVANNLFNNSNGEINNVPNIEAGGVFNNGLIEGRENEALKIKGNNDNGGFFNNGIINAPGPDGIVNLQNPGEELQNFGQIFGGKVVMLHFRRIVNQEGKEIKAGENVYMYGDVSNLGEIGTDNEVGNQQFGGSVDIKALNTEGTGTVENKGTIRGGNGAPNTFGDSVFIESDMLGHSGTIIPGIRGEGEFVYDGYTMFWSRMITVDPSTYIHVGESSVSFTGNQVIFQPASENSYQKFMADQKPIIETDYLSIRGHGLTFRDLPANSFAAGYIRFETADDEDAFIDFSGLKEGPVFLNSPDQDAELISKKIIAPEIGLEALFSGGIFESIGGGYSSWEMTMVVPPVISNQGKTDSMLVFLRNQHERARTFEYKINSEEEWVRAVEAETRMLDPWESEGVYVVFDVPSDVSEIFRDEVIIQARIMGNTWQETRNTITAFPMDVSSVPMEDPDPFPAPITLVQPANDAQNVPLMTEFSWDEEENAVQYRFELSTDPLFEELVGDPVIDLDTHFSWTEELVDGETYYWRVRGENYSGPGEWSEVFQFHTGQASSGGTDELPGVFILLQNYPNPFNPVTSIPYVLPTSEYVEIRVYNIMGQQIASLVESHLEAGHHVVAFDGSGISSGVYFYRMKAGDFADVRQMLLIK